MKRAPSPRQPLNVRRQALHILSRVGERQSGVYAVDLIDALDAKVKLNQRDRRFLTELTYGVLRHRLTLDSVISSYASVPLAQLEPSVIQSLRLALYQVLYLDGIPPFAAVSSSVELLPQAHLKSFVNGILRTVLREMKKVTRDRDALEADASQRLPLDGKVVWFARPVFVEPAADPLLHLAQVSSYPVELVSRWVSRYGRDRAVLLLASGNRRPELIARVNLHRGSLATAQEALLEAGLASEPISACGLRIRGAAAELLRSPAFRQGLVSVQGAFAQQAIPLLNPAPGTLCLDLCAAPGGKSTHMAEHAGDQARVIACDTDAVRLARVVANASRLGLRSIWPLAVDGARGVPVRAAAASVLVDAPCSNTAVLSRRPEARWRFDGGALESLRTLQRQLLEQAAAVVAAGGRLLYSTCSLEPEENEELVRAFLAGRAEFTLVAERAALPGEGSDDGGYLALLERRA